MYVYCAYCGKQINTDRDNYFSPGLFDTKYFCDRYNCYNGYQNRLHKEKVEAKCKSGRFSSSSTSTQFTGHKEQKFPDGSRYVGDFVDGKMHGKGKWFDADGTSYVGDWVNDQRTGKGKMTFTDGNYYEGDFVIGAFHGYGKLTLADGSVYTGQFRENKINGKGKLTLTDGSYYEGDFLDGKRTGKGKLIWPNGCYYEGDFVDGDFNGYGIRLYSDGYKYEGQFKDDKRHGKGILTSPDGTAIEYYYEDDEIVLNATESSVPTLPKTTATAEVRKTETAVPVAKVVEESLEESSEQKIWNSLLKMSEKEKKAYFETHHELTVPAGTEVIPAKAFEFCLGLKKINFNDDIREIGEYAFYCTGIDSVLMIPKSVSKIRDHAFAMCHVEKIIFPNNITVEEYAFAYIKALSEVIFETDLPQDVVFGKKVFARSDKRMTKEMIEKIKNLNSNAFK